MTRDALVVLLCAEHGARFDLTTLAAEAPVEVVPDLCRNPARAVTAVRGRAASRVVAGLCAPDSDRELPGRLRRAGLDPFALERAPLYAAATPSAARALLAAAVARALTGGPTPAENVRVRLSDTPVGRRSLLSLPPVLYDPVAAIGAACVGTQRCGLCVDACPHGVIRVDDNLPVVDKAGCTACGACVAACPLDAVSLPRSDHAAHEAGLRALLTAALDGGGTAGVAFTCRGRSADLAGLADVAPGWLPVEVPCLALVSSGWILQTLAAGAGAVALLGCGSACGAGSETTTAARVTFCRSVLAAAGIDDRSVLATSTIDSLGPVPLGRRVASTLRLVEPAATADSIVSLMAGATPVGAIPSAGSPLAGIDLDQQRCTGCGACAATCATAALTLSEETDEVVLTFDPAACTGCGHCARVCPEDAVRVRPEVRIDTLRRGPAPVFRDVMPRCRRCGAPVAGAGLLARVESLLDDAPPDLLRTLRELCPDCRGLGVPSDPGSPG